MHVMCGPENFHPAGSWNGWRMTSELHHGHASYDVIVPFSFFCCFNKLWTIYFHVKNYDL
jgi:hypothetical protein